jgi:RHH-type transcriptional regulator, proline utilization regulon repressor / proline dehydrogenase / delta 1-pyrroline-5-carboxylate dehydrogenase
MASFTHKQDAGLAADTRRAAVRALARADEEAVVRDLIGRIELTEAQREHVRRRARALVEHIRAHRRVQGGIDIFMSEYDLSTEEGITLMCLAEALLRVPDAATQDALIRDKIGGRDWARHLGRSDSLFVNASTWALMLTGRVVELDGGARRDIDGVLGRLVARSGEPVIRQALTHAMHIIGRQFVMGETIEDALKRADDDAEARRYRYSFDMLGEGARTAADAARYFDSYMAAIAAIGRGVAPNVRERPGISVKLSALHPRFEMAQRERVLAELVPRVVELARAAAAANIGLTVDAEEAPRLELTLDVVERAAMDVDPAWEGFGLAVQAYQKRASGVIDWVADLAARARRRFMVRLVKGAYWDSEIKWAQQGGYDGYSVFTRKEATDVSYLVCASRMLRAGDSLYSQFATHNAHTVASVIELAGERRSFEFQRLHGMGRPLYDHLLSDPHYNCRVYAPVGGHKELLAYLVRRLLENGANTSFVNRLAHDELPIGDVIADPDGRLLKYERIPNPNIPLPKDLYGRERRNARGLDLDDPVQLAEAQHAVARFTSWPSVPNASRIEIDRALDAAQGAQRAWDARCADARATILERAADLFEANRGELMAIAVHEAKKTFNDAVAEVREAVDFLRYYAREARTRMGAPQPLPGPTGERNELELHGRGTFASISPWNFPLAIFTGQVVAALAAGNAVAAKPAEQTPKMGRRAVELLHEAGVPQDVLHLVAGDGKVGAALVADARISGVVFTGSVEVAHSINRTLAERDGPIAPLIAETGGINAMIVDSSALPEQVVDDAVVSAFRSAGQRCSALRLLVLQDDVADDIIRMLVGKANELLIGAPADIATDVGPLIDADACATLEEWARKMDREAKPLFEAELGPSHARDTFFAPRIYEIERISQLTRETFGPIIHVVRYAADEIDTVVDAINGLGYGLTLGIHSRVDAFAEALRRRLRVGNTYVNRNIIGAVVGVQPFGGEGLSGTGPKAGGPHYLPRFTLERTLTVNTAAVGGNASLLAGT